MNLDSVGKRLGLILVIMSIIIFLVTVLVWSLMVQRPIAYHMPNGEVFYYQRGYMETMLVEWLEFTLIIFPAFFCGLALLLGYGNRLLNWIKNGSPADNEVDDSAKK